MRKGLWTIPVLLLLAAGDRVRAQETDAAPYADSVAVVEKNAAPKPAFFSVERPEPVAVRPLPADEMERLRRSDDYWYANLEKQDEPKTVPARKKQNWLAEKWVQNLLWIVILCSFIAVVIWYLASSNVFIFRSRAKKISDEATEGGNLPEDIFSIHYDHEIARAVKASDYRLAVRLQYLQTLTMLAGRNLIHFRADRTDSDYLADLFKGPYYRDFFNLSRNFAYVWYGQFAISADTYDLLQRDFVAFKNRVAS